ncbi:MAG: hypothetical protein E3J76_05095 [Candidatus Aminicenantes bacterium]|nr:MAG: hypothetical protein E3J76_05095 [Candidatus Aminicenantes bacterium]
MKEEVEQITKFPLGIVVISVIMFFAALATDIFWLTKLAGKAFPSTMPLDPAVYSAFAVPDIVLSLFLYIGAFGLIKLRKYGFVVSLVAMGMWIFDSLLVLSITKLNQINIVGPCLFFAFFTVVYLWTKKRLFN